MMIIKVGALPVAAAERGATLPGVCRVQQPGGETGALFSFALAARTRPAAAWMSARSVGLVPIAV